MRCKGLLLDIDNTLYSYSDTHRKALEQLILTTHNETSKSKELIKEALGLTLTFALI